MVCVEFTILGNVPLGVKVVRLARPLEGVSHPLYEGHNLNRLDIKVVHGDTSEVYLQSRALT